MTPFRFQKECVREIEWFRGRCGLFLDPGLGKTFTSLLWLKRNKKFPAVVVCPASVKWVWEREAQSVLGLESQVLEGRNGDVGSASSRIVIINYDILSGWIDWLRSCVQPKTVIIDECQFIANFRAKRTKAVRLLCRKVPHILALSGTPLTSRPIQLWPTISLLCGTEFCKWPYFVRRYCDPKETPWGTDVRGASNIPELNKRLAAKCMIRRRKADVLTDLPEKIRSMVPLDMSDRQEYEHAKTDLISWLCTKDRGAALRAAGVEPLVKVGYLLRLAARLKMDAMVQWINEWLTDNPDEKLLVFAEHHDILKPMKERVAQWSLLIDGSVKGSKRRDAVDQFQNDCRYRVLFGQTQAAGVGLTLTAASTVVFAELSWTPGALLQAEDRAHRIGTTKTVWIYYMVARNSVEEDLCRIVHAKQKVLDGVLDGRGKSSDSNVFDELLRSLK